MGAMTPKRVRVARFRTRAMMGMCPARVAQTCLLSSISAGTISQVIWCLAIRVHKMFSSAVLAC